MKEVRDTMATLLDEATLARVLERADALARDEKARQLYSI